MSQNFFTQEDEPRSECTHLDLNISSLESKGLCLFRCRLGARSWQKIWMYGILAAAMRTCYMLDISSQLVVTCWMDIKPLEGESRGCGLLCGGF